MIGVDDGMCADFEDEVQGEEEIQVKDDVDSESACGDCEVENIKPMKDPGNPTLEQPEEHRAPHLPYRSWCRWCVLGRGRGRRHVSASASSRSACFLVRSRVGE